MEVPKIIKPRKNKLILLSLFSFGLKYNAFKSYYTGRIGGVGYNGDGPVLPVDGRSGIKLHLNNSFFTRVNGLSRFFGTGATAFYFGIADNKRLVACIGKSVFEP